MGFLSVALTFVGYVLVYGSVANHGKFAVSPWAGVVADAYDTGRSPDKATADADAGAVQDMPAVSTTPTTPAAPTIPSRKRWA